MTVDEGILNLENPPNSRLLWGQAHSKHHQNLGFAWPRCLEKVKNILIILNGGLMVSLMNLANGP